jgi:30S ribosomal protein 3
MLEMMVSEEAGTAQEEVVASHEASGKSDNQEKTVSNETKSGRPGALGGAAALATATIDADGRPDLVSFETVFS